MQITFNYLTKPSFLRGLAKRGLRKSFQDYARAIDHHVTTGENVTAENWKEIKKKYR